MTFQLTDWLIDGLFDWLTDWLTDCLADFLTYGLTFWQNDWLACWPVDWLTNTVTGSLALSDCPTGLHPVLADWLAANSYWPIDWLTGSPVVLLTDWITNWLTNTPDIRTKTTTWEGEIISTCSSTDWVAMLILKWVHEIKHLPYYLLSTC